MSSIIEGYNYDIFISYRQKDNKHDGWVTEFVNNLKGELESTFKEEISVYFDINPHDGLLETHDVDASLKDKLKCLIFIPIISRTYCDPKSFAWEHEFKAFVEQASQDQFRLKVKLPNGNVTNRVLPVRIHDLNIADAEMFESVIGGVLRGVDFVYKSPGVNRPLRAKEDKPHENLNNTIYRDQINKVALAINEIISGLKLELKEGGKERSSRRQLNVAIKDEASANRNKKPTKLSFGKFIQGGLILIAALIIVVFVFYQKIFNVNPLHRLKSYEGKTVVVTTPFQNNTNDTLWNVWQNGIQNELITYLTNLEELKVRQQETVNNLIHSKGLTNYASITPSFSKLVAQKLEANILISGNINQAGKIIRINAQLIEPKTGDIIKSFQIEGPAKEDIIFNIIDSLSLQLRDYLLLTKLLKESSRKPEFISKTCTPEAYRLFVQGQNAFNKMDYPTARELYLKAITLDSNFYAAEKMLAVAYRNQNMFVQAKEWCLKAYGKRDQMPLVQSINISWLHALLFETPVEEIKYLDQLLELDNLNPMIYYELGRVYVALSQYDKAIQVLEKAFEIYQQWESKPRWVNDYIMLGYAYQKSGQYKKERQLFKKAVKSFPDDPELIYRQSVLALTAGDTVTANHLIKKYILLKKESLSTDADIDFSLGDLYLDANLPNKAALKVREALSLDPENPSKMNFLAYLLIDNEINISEGLNLVSQALKIEPDNFNFLHTKGWGLYKQGKYRESLVTLQKSWDLRRRYAEYDYTSFLHLEAARKAVAGQKN
jgi:tetratricopeptide (TPR) repeat protein